jgi:alkyl sulfatase BDS1-like metallo-beta-lactamase superfamily hydrolase
LHAVKAPPEYLAKPWLRARYDDPEFLVRGIYHLYGGWFDGNPAHLKPAKAADIAQELARLAGGAERLAERAAALAVEGNTRLAAHLAELASDADPADKTIQAIRASVLRKCIERESSLMGKAFLAVYDRDADGRSKG